MANLALQNIGCRLQGKLYRRRVLGHAYPRVLNPQFRTQQSKAEPEPERDSKEFMRRESACDKERAHDEARGCNPESNAEGPDHPFAMLRNAAMPDVPDPKTQKDEKEDGEKSCGGSFVRTAYGRRVAQDKGGPTDHGSKSNQEPS